MNLGELINLFSSNFIGLPNLSSLSHGESKWCVAIPEKPGVANDPCSKEMNRWISRWENEGGSILRGNA